MKYMYKLRSFSGELSFLVENGGVKNLAIVKFINSKASLKKSLDYITKECKTNDNLITVINCNKESAYDEMMFTNA